MRSATAFTVCLVICLAVVGCAEEESAQRAMARKDMNAAIALFDEVDTGYVPAESESASTHQTLDAFRQDRFADAAERLEPVLESPSPTQRQAARQLLADVHASAARHALREAMANWTNLTGESVDLFNLLLTVDRASARVRAYQIDDSELLKQLEEEQLKAKRDIGVDEGDAKAKAQQIADLEEKIAKLRKKRDDAVAEGRRYRDQAFAMRADDPNKTAEQIREERFQLYKKAAEVERAGQEEFKKAQLHTVDLKGLQGDHAALQRQIETRKRYLASIEQQIEVTVRRAGEVRQALDEAQTNLADTIKRLETRIDGIAAQYQQQVDAKFAEAEKRIEQAVAILDKAAKDDAGPHFDRRDVELELLGKMVTKVYILTSHVLALADFGQTLAVIADRAYAADRGGLMYERASGLRQSATQVADKQGRLIGLTLAAIKKGKDLAGELTENASEGDTAAEIANSHSLRLTSFRDQLNTLKLPGLPDNLDMLMPMDVAASSATGGTGGSDTTPAPPVSIVPTLEDAKFAIELFADALKSKDTTMAKEFLLLPSDESRVQRLEAALTALASDDSLSITMGKGKMQGKWAIVAVTYKTSQGSQTRDVMLYHKGSEWKIVDEGVRGDESIKALFDRDAEDLLEWYRSN